VDFRPHRKSGGKGQPKSTFVRRLGKHDQLVDWYKPKKKAKWMTQDQHDALPATLRVRELRYWLAQKGQRTRVITVVTTLLYTGMRVGIEALRMKWSDIDFGESLITVSQSKTLSSQRNIPMASAVKSALRGWHAATGTTSEYVFFNPQHPQTHIRCVKTAWHNALKLAGLPRRPIYSCRHVFATRLAASGVSDTIIDQLLGHSRRDVLRFYTVRVPEYLRDAIQQLEALRASKTQVAGIVSVSECDQSQVGSSKLLN